MKYQKNEDGTDKLDEQGNPIPVEITDEDKEKEFAKVNENLVEELKELRLKNSIMKDLLENKKEEQPEPVKKEPLTDEEKLEALLEKKLQEKEASNAQANKKAAFEKFIRDEKEFSPENDPTGLKRDALQKKFNRFNTDGLVSVDEFTSVIREAKLLLVKSDNSLDTTMDKNPYSNPGKSVNDPAGKRNDELTPKELKLCKQTGKTREDILKMRVKHPGILKDLLEFVSD